MSTSANWAVGPSAVGTYPALPLRAVQRAGTLPKGTVPVALGLGVLGITSYGYLAVAARTLTPTEFTRLGIVWTLLFTLGPGLFLPLEQDLSRRLAAAPDRSARQLVTRAAAVGVVLVLAIVALAAAGGPAIASQLFGGDDALLVATVAASAVLAIAYGSRGLLAGQGSFRRYAVQLGADGALRLVGVVLLALAAQRSAVPYAWLLALAPLCAVAISLARRSNHAVAQRSAEEALPDSSILRGLAWLLAGALLAQALVNGGVIAVKLLAPPDDVVAGRFLTALLLARVPLLLFAALQASLLPGLSRHAAVGDTAGLRQALRRCVIAVLVLGGATTAVLAALGDQLSALLFGSSYQVGAATMTLLCASSIAVMVCVAVAQALLATHHTAAVAVAWLLGFGGFVAALLLPGSITLRVSLAMLAGSSLAVVACCLALHRWVPRRSRGHRP